MKFCRLCLSKDETNIISILNNKETDLIEKIKACVSVEINENDHLPTTACVLCIKKVKDWWKFRDNCLKTNELLLTTTASINSKHFVRKCSRKKYKYLEYNETNFRLSDDRIIDNCQDDKLNETINNNCGIDEFNYDALPDFKLPENTSYTCDICNKSFNYCFDYLDHQETHNGELVFQCDKCAESYTTREDLLEHDRNHRQPCKKCGKMILKSSMKLHLIKHTDRHICSHCSNRFNSKATLLQHIITIHTNIKDHICETCGKRFSSKTAMTVHLRSHSDERLYRCKLCNYAGRTASAVYVHMSTHANEVCVCEVCSKIFKSTRNLNDHLRRVHSKEKRHECTYCNKKFVDRYMLTVHLRCHTGVRPYQCTVCDKAFIRSDGLKEHMSVHGERIWHHCGNCGKKFASKKGVARHNCSVV